MPNFPVRSNDIISKENPFPDFCDLTATSITKENAGDIIHLHVERQTLRHLPKSKDILFTIKTYLTPIADIVLNDKDIAERLASAIRAWPPEVVKYKVHDISSVSSSYHFFSFYRKWTILKILYWTIWTTLPILQRCDNISLNFFPYLSLDIYLNRVLRYRSNFLNGINFNSFNSMIKHL
jgi:hypothetical protein